MDGQRPWGLGDTPEEVAFRRRIWLCFVVVRAAVIGAVMLAGVGVLFLVAWGLRALGVL